MCNLWATYHSDLANEEHYPEKFDEQFKMYIDKTVENINVNLNRQDANLPEEDTITVQEIENQIKQLSKGKAPGPDFLTNEHLIYSGNTLVENLCLLFNAILREKYVPEIFKVGKIISIYKGKNKDKCSPTNYRGITLTSIISKLFEKVILLRIENDFISSGVSFPHELQFGFRNDHGAIPACYVLKEIICYYVNKGSPVFCVFLDGGC